MSAPPHRPPTGRAGGRPVPVAEPLDDRELDEFQALLDRIPAPFDPLDVAMVDGFLCGVLVQPEPVPSARWLMHITDSDGRTLPQSFDVTRLQSLATRRHAELDAAIGRREWFDPWVFEIGPAEGDADESGDDGAAASPVDAVVPWVAGMALALEVFPALMQLPAALLTEPLALLYRHLSPDDLEDADDLLAEIDSLEPPADLTEAVEGLVRATLLLADIGRPLGRPGARRNNVPNAAAKRAPRHGRRSR